jgi:voltage-gated potassium channel Kch
VLIGDTEAARRICQSLRNADLDLTHLLAPSERDLRLALTADTTAVAVVVRGDIAALRYALLVEHIRPDVRLLATLFDRTIADQLRTVVPNCEVTSPADIAVPSLVAACLDRGRIQSSDRAILAVDQTGPTPMLITESAGIHTQPWIPARRRWDRIPNLLSGQFRAHDTTARVLIAGALGLLGILVIDWLIVVLALHESPDHAIYNATRVVATVGPGDVAARAQSWYLVLSSVFMLLTIGFTALLTAGLVNRLLSTRSIAIIGRRTMPTSDHIVVIGLGQVGLRLCIQLRKLGIRVVAVERDPDASNLRLAKDFGIPVLIAHADDRRVLNQLSLHRAQALAAMGSEDLDNVEVAIAALAVEPSVRIVLRAGDSGVIAETRSLFSVGEVRDVSAYTALAISRNLLGLETGIIVGHGSQTGAIVAGTDIVDTSLAVHDGCLCTHND